LVWAKVGGHPWWPCMITSAPSNEVLNECITHVKYIGTTRPKRMFYVQFFGTTIEHAWVPEGCLIDYGGIEAFKTYAQDQVDQAMTKSAKEKLAERFQLKVALSRRENWELAVKEADLAMKKSISERKLYFTKKYRSNFLSFIVFSFI
jgi:histone-lysine N-methyltransferase NSD2